MELKTFQLYEKVKGNDTPKSIDITESAAQAILRQWKTSPNAELFDSGGKLVDVVNRNEWRVRSKNETKGDKTVGAWFCGYGTAHLMNISDCGCGEKFGVPDCVLKDWCQKAYPDKDFIYDNDTPDYMREEFLRVKSLTV